MLRRLTVVQKAGFNPARRLPGPEENSKLLRLKSSSRIDPRTLILNDLSARPWQLGPPLPAPRQRTPTLVRDPTRRHLKKLPPLRQKFQSCEPGLTCEGISRGAAPRQQALWGMVAPLLMLRAPEPPDLPGLIAGFGGNEASSSRPVHP